MCVFICQHPIQSERLLDLPDEANDPSAFRLETPGEVSPAAD